jgi:Zn-finger nucleic acid-binding protein
MIKRDILLCPACGKKTRTIVREDTTLTNYPLFCPKCKCETLVSVRNLDLQIIQEPVARAPKPPLQFPPQTQSR